MAGGGNGCDSALLGATFKTGGGGVGAGRTSSKKHVKNSIPFLGMWKIYGNLQRLNK